ncbi:MAG: sigma-70 family RNA polymerase sigma factor [Chloroflexota bacterium]
MNGKKDDLCNCDECILKMIRLGESSLGYLGWSIWYERDFEVIHRFANRRLARWAVAHLAEDVAQDAFLLGWSNIVSGRFQYTGRSLCAYLTGITKNLIRDRVRKNARENNLIFEDYDSAAKGLTPEQDVMIQEHIDLILLGFEQLKPSQKSVLFSTYAQGKNSQEVGSDLGLSQENARIIAMRGVRSIQKQVGQVYGLELSTAAVRTGLEFIPAVL